MPGVAFIRERKRNDGTAYFSTATLQSSATRGVTL
jgi:hypothetical protein